MTRHLFAIVLTPFGTAANNRGETDGNLTTLQKLLWNGQIHTTVSAEAIRWAIRYAWQQSGEVVNREWDETARRHTWNDADFASGGATYVDDDVLGYMSAKAAKEEASAPEKSLPDESQPQAGLFTAGQQGNAPEKAPGGKAQPRAPRARGTATVRRARLEVTRAVSLQPWSGDISFNAASVGATPSASKTGRDPVPYGAEIHATRYQYGVAMTPSELEKPERALLALDALLDLHQVAGNHGRFLYDFSPDAVAFRWTSDFAPRMLYAFAQAPGGSVEAPELTRRVRAGDVDPAELVVGGSMATTETGIELARLGATVLPGVKAAFQEVRRRMAADRPAGAT